MEKLLRRLNLKDSILLVIGSVIGSGNFLTTGYIADYLPSPILIIAIWAIGGFITIAGALTFAELGSMFPESGGKYIYLRQAYKPWAAFFYGWGFFWVIECGGIAALAIGFAEYFGYFFPSLSTSSILLKFEIGPIVYHLSAGQVIGAVAIIILSLINYFGVESGVRIQNIFTILRIFALVSLIALGLSIGKKLGLQNYRHFFSGLSGLNFKLFGLAIIACLWTYDGWYAVNCTAEEIRRPERNIPLGLGLGTLIVTVIYMVTNLVYLFALPMEKIRGVVRIGEAFSAQLLGPRAAFIFSAIVAITIFGCLSATIIYGPRVYLAMARDGLFFKSMAYVHPRYHVPSRAITGQMIWSCFLCLSGSYRSLFEYVVFALVLFFAASGLAVIVLRFKSPERERPYKVWGYPFLPLAFVLVNLAIFLNTVWTQPVKSLIGTFILFLGIPAFLFWRKNQMKERAT